MGRYRGRVLTRKQYDRAKNDDYIWEVNSNRFIDGLKPVKGNPLRFVNGAATKAQMKKVNVEVYFKKGHVYYRTIKPVKKGKEFFIDYGDEYFV